MPTEFVLCRKRMDLKREKRFLFSNSLLRCQNGEMNTNNHIDDDSMWENGWIAFMIIVWLILGDGNHGREALIGEPRDESVQMNAAFNFHSTTIGVCVRVWTRVASFRMFSSSSFLSWPFFRISFFEFNSVWLSMIGQSINRTTAASIRRTNKWKTHFSIFINITYSPIRSFRVQIAYADCVFWFNYFFISWACARLRTRFIITIIMYDIFAAIQIRVDEQLPLIPISLHDTKLTVGAVVVVAAEFAHCAFGMNCCWCIFIRPILLFPSCASALIEIRIAREKKSKDEKRNSRPRNLSVLRIFHSQTCTHARTHT